MILEPIQVNTLHNQLATWPPVPDTADLSLNVGPHFIYHGMGAARNGINKSKSDFEGRCSFSALH